MNPKKPIIYRDWITRYDLKIAPGVYFIFGDNCARKGRGGQAAEMRGEPNAIGVVTKRSPSMDEGAFFSDDEDADRIALASDLLHVVGLWNAGHQIVASSFGLGTERARLREKAPGLYKMLYETFQKMSGPDFPWPKP
jgi:hypothetical protein